MRKEIPGWIWAVVSVLYRFVVGAFGVSLPHPYPTSLCPPFWATVVGMTIGLPIVLMGWLIRLVFGRGRITWLVETSRIKKIPARVFYVFLWLWAVFFIGLWSYVAFEKYGWWGPLVIIGIIMGVIGFVGGLSFLSLRWLGRSRPITEKEVKKIYPVVVVSAVANGIGDLFYTLGLMIYATYKKFCPYGKLP